MGKLKHGASRRTTGETVTYRRWKDMKTRVRRQPQYVSKGITVCERWQTFPPFLADLGECPPGYSLERLDNDGHYCPENCCWIPRSEQAKHTSKCHPLTYQGRTQTMNDWARELGVPHQRISKRLKRGWSVERALGQPARKWKRD